MEILDSVFFWFKTQKVMWQFRQALRQISKMQPDEAAQIITRWRWHTSQMEECPYKEEMLTRINEFENAIKKRAGKRELYGHVLDLLAVKSV